MDLLIAIVVALVMMMLYCCIKAGALSDQLMEALKKTNEEKQTQRKEPSQREEQDAERETR